MIWKIWKHLIFLQISDLLDEQAKSCLIWASVHQSSLLVWSVTANWIVLSLYYCLPILKITIACIYCKNLGNRKKKGIKTTYNFIKIKSMVVNFWHISFQFLFCFVFRNIHTQTQFVSYFFVFCFYIFFT